MIIAHTHRPHYWPGCTSSLRHESIYMRATVSTYNQCSLNSPHLHVFGMGKEAWEAPCLGLLSFRFFKYK